MLSLYCAVVVHAHVDGKIICLGEAAGVSAGVEICMNHASQLSHPSLELSITPRGERPDESIDLHQEKTWSLFWRDAGGWGRDGNMEDSISSSVSDNGAKEKPLSGAEQIKFFMKQAFFWANYGVREIRFVSPIMTAHDIMANLAKAK